MSWLFITLAACTPKDVDTGSSAPPINSGGGDSGCEGTAPVIDQLTIGNGGVRAFDDGDFPTVGIQAEVSDADADLDVVSMDVWVDDQVDGSVVTTGAAFDGPPYEVSDDACAVATTTFSLNIQAGGSLQYDTLYEFAAVVTDGHGDESAVAIASGYTPKEDGSDGG